MVTVKSAFSDILEVDYFGRFDEMSMPFSFMASTIVGLTFSANLIPALEAVSLLFP